MLALGVCSAEKNVKNVQVAVTARVCLLDKQPLKAPFQGWVGVSLFSSAFPVWLQCAKLGEVLSRLKL